MPNIQNQIESLHKKIKDYHALRDSLGDLTDEKIAVLKQEIETLIQQQNYAIERDKKHQLEHPLPAGNLTFLFTDIEGSTELWEQHPEAMKSALGRHDAILHQAVEVHNGHIFKGVGDGFHAAFPSAMDALAATMAAQRALYTEVWGETPIKVRMALHTGIADAHDGDYSGPVFNRLARLLSAGYGGQTLLSAATYELLPTDLSPGVELRDMGERRLRSLTRPEHIYQITVPDLPAQFPPLKTLEPTHTNLPIQLTSFIGRKKEMIAVNALMKANRLITLTGAGGAGKTRLSLQIAAGLLDSSADGIWFVELASLADAALIQQAVASTLGLHEESNRPLLDVLTNYLRPKNTLLILDNCEHLIEAAARFAEHMLHNCPNLRLLVSSRETLGIPGEAAYRVPSLSIPNPSIAYSVTDLTTIESVRLFIERAQAVTTDFALSNENAPAIAQICSRLDGIPLAIELAAARVKMLRVEQIAARLDDCFRLLTGGSRTALPRQQTLRALIDWSYNLLSEAECVLLRRLSVFAGGWTLETAEQVCSNRFPAEHQSFGVLDLLSQLVNKSLVVVDADKGPEIRYHLLETVRQYAREKLSESGEGMAVRDVHLQCFLALAERAEPDLIGSKALEWQKHLDSELDNIRAALEWSLNRDAQIGLGLASALMRYWPTHNHSQEGIDWLSQLLRQPSAFVGNLVRAKALIVLAWLSQSNWQSEGMVSKPLAEEGLALYRELGDQRGIAFALLILGESLAIHDNTAGARASLLESLKIYRSLGDKWGIAQTLANLGLVTGDGRDYLQGRAYLEESLAIYKDLHWELGIALRLANLGWLAAQCGDYAPARRWLSEAIEIFRRLGVFDDLPYATEQLGVIALREGDYEQARAYLEECISLLRENGHDVDLWIFAHLGYVALRQGDTARARSLFIKVQQGFKESKSKIGMIYIVEGLASLAVLQGQPVRAIRLFAWADVMRKTVGDARPANEQADVDRDLAAIRAQLDEATIVAAQAAGRAMTLDEAVAFALQESNP
jgi:predicted ATPase/class 3 adenylate cyclase